MASQRMYDVTIQIGAKIMAQNAGEAVEKLSQAARDGLGPDDKERKYGARIYHASATTKSVFIPEKEPK